jgi:hypothetical protein
MSCRPQKIYVAGPWDERDRAAWVAAELVKRGHTITHDWWNYDGGGDQSQEFLAKCAWDDFRAVMDADVFLLLNTQKRGEETSGKAVELGIALATNLLAPEHDIRIIITGIRMTNLFHYLPEVEYFETVEEAIEVI